ncbi:MAG: aminotransferase class III-fold pyridoxal phosphate-dependent enzyme, partial [Planctomycetales bacterium]
LLFPTFRAPCPTPYRLPPDVSSEEALDYYVDRAEAVLAEHHERIAAFVVEPLIQGAAGIIVHPSGYLRRIRELTRKYDVLLIADEVAVGMGRTGTLFACDQEDVSPDLLCMAKGLTGGYLPLAATLATDEIHQAFLGEFAEQKTFFHGHTYGGNPLGAAVAIATLDVFEEERTLEHLPAKEARLNEHLARIAELPHVGDVRGRGLMAGVELVRDRDSKESFPLGEKRGYRACDFAMQHGVRLRPLGDVVVIMPPLSVSMEELDRICEAVEIGIRKATET